MTRQPVVRARGKEKVLTWEEADARAGRRLDRRRRWAFIKDKELPELCSLVQFSESCSGCNEHPEMTLAPERGDGCHECGYTGRRRQAFFVPHIFKEKN